MTSADDLVAGPIGKTVDTYLTRIVPFGFSGSALVAGKGEIFLNKGYGLADRSSGVPNTAGTVHSLGSITKQFTAAAIMKLEVQGKLNTEDLISLYLPGVTEDKGNITLHHLLTHTAGVINYTGEDYVAIDREEMIEAVMAAPLAFAPGERYQYSNAGYSLLAAIVEIVSYQPFGIFLQEQLFDPTGMQLTGYQMPDWKDQVIARWYLGQVDNGTALEKPYPYWNIMGNGEMLSTTADMLKWHQALSGNSVLSAAAKRKLYTPFQRNYAYGWEVLETEHGTLVQHDGASDLGSSASFRRFLDEDVVIILLFNHSPDGTPLCKLIEDKVATLVFGGQVPVPPQTIRLDRSRLDSCTGSYQLESGGYLQVAHESGALIVTADGQDAINALAFPDAPISAHADLNERAQSLFAAAIAGDYAPFAQELDGDQARAERYRATIEGAAQEAGMGQILGVHVGGTAPSFLPDAVATEVKLEEESGGVSFHLYWRNGQLLGLSPAVSSQPVTLPCQPISPEEFVGYQLGTTTQVRLGFVVDDQGMVSNLALFRQDGQIFAARVSEAD